MLSSVSDFSLKAHHSPLQPRKKLIEIGGKDKNREAKLGRERTKAQFCLPDWSQKKTTQMQ